MPIKTPRTFVITLGGNSLLRAKEKGNTEDQYRNLWQTSQQLLELLSSGNRIVIAQGNGPQVGNLLLALESSRHIVPSMSLDICVAATQEFIGYMLQKTIADCLRESGVNNPPASWGALWGKERGKATSPCDSSPQQAVGYSRWNSIKHNITAVVTQVIVDKDDPAFKNPTKLVGPFYDLKDEQKLCREKGWKMIEDSARGYRRLVPSPRPVSIQQARIIRSMLDAEEIVIVAGGRSIPVIREAAGTILGIEAVIDNDYTSSRLAIDINSDVILYLTAVEKVCHDFALPSQKPLDHLNLNEAQALLDEGQLGKGSMEPKIRAAIEFIEKTGREVIITLAETAIVALQGKTGTRITA